MRVLKVKQIVSDWIGVDFIVFDPAVPEVFYFKHEPGISFMLYFLLAILTPIALVSLATPF